jgi:hypothetical protein
MRAMAVSFLALSRLNVKMFSFIKQMFEKTQKIVNICYIIKIIILEGAKLCISTKALCIYELYWTIQK